MVDDEAPHLESVKYIDAAAMVALVVSEGRSITRLIVCFGRTLAELIIVF